MKRLLSPACLFLVLWATPVAAAPEANVEITYRIVGQAMLPSEWTVLLRSSAAQDEPAARHPARGAEPLWLQLAPGSNWEISAELPGFWVPRKTLTVGQAGEPASVVLDLWPLGTVSGRVKVQQKGVSSPREVLVKTVAAPSVLQRPSMPPGVLTCPVDKKGSWNCSLPAGKFDLVVTAPGFTPHYRWGVEVPPAKTLELGVFTFERGSSVAGWVAVEGGAIDPKTCVARLSFMAACGAAPDSLIQLQRIAVERPVSKEGFLQIAGLAPGIYSLEVRQPGLAAARITNIRVDPEAETFLPEPLLLARPIAFDITITPPVDERGEPWRAKVFRRSEDAAQPDPVVFDGPADSAGRFTVGEQSPGWFRVALLDSRDNWVHSEPERQIEASIQQTIKLSRVAVEGTLRLGSKPLQGTLWFGGRSGFTSVKMEADEEGRFTGILPDRKSGIWTVDVEATEPKLQIRTRTEIRPDRSGRATALVELPDTRVFGHVVDAQGRPVKRAMLLAASESLRQITQADADGKFDLRGLPPGSLALFAKEISKDSAGQSERTLLSLGEDGEIGPVELRLRAMKRVEGVVSSSRGPVAGALVRARARPPAVGEGQATTGPDGAFSLEIPDNVVSVEAAVSAPGYGIQAFPLAAGEKALSLTLSETAGDIVIALPDTAELQRENRQVTLFQNGMEIPMTLLQGGSSAASADGPALRFAGLAPGSYSACLTRIPVASTGALDPAAIPKEACDSGQLATGATLALTLRD
jgi:hypothetical protein